MIQPDNVGHDASCLWPGTTYDCAACEARCACTGEDDETMCVYCARMLAEFHHLV